MINVNFPMPMDKLFKIRAIVGTIVFFGSIYIFAEIIINVENEKNNLQIEKSLIENKRKDIEQAKTAARNEFRYIINKSKVDISYLNELSASVSREEFNKIAKPMTENLDSMLDKNITATNVIQQREKELNSNIIKTQSKEKLINLYDGWKLVGYFFEALILIFSIILAFPGFKRWNYEESVNPPVKPKSKK